MSLKMHFLFSHLDFFLSNCGDVNDEHGERFHHDFSVMGHRYKGKWGATILRNYCWMMKRDVPETKYHRQAKKHSVKFSIYFPFIFIVHINMIVLLSRKQELTNKF